MEEKILGKITSAKFGFADDNQCLMGLRLSFSLEGGSRGVGCGGKYTVNISDECKWDNETEKFKEYEQVLKRLEQVLKEAKVKYVSELIGKPVEVTIEGNGFKSFRILTEVL